MTTDTTHLTLDAECAEVLGLEDGDEIEVEVTFAVEQDSFDHEFGTEYGKPYLEIESVVIKEKNIDIVELLTDEMLEELDEAFLPSRNAYRWNYAPNKQYKYAP